MAIDGWAYSGTGNNLKGNLANAMVLHEMFRHTNLIKMAGHTMGTASIDHNATESALNTTGLFFQALSGPLRLRAGRRRRQLARCPLPWIRWEPISRR